MNDKKARRFHRALSSREREDCGLCRLFLHYRLFVLRLALGRLRTPAGTLGKGSLNLLDRFGLGDSLVLLSTLPNFSRIILDT